jgi:enamine deaminase RidA (YjgF/YER057c/UK114 family)
MAVSDNRAIHLNAPGLWPLPIFSHVVIAPRGRTVYISGQVAFDEHGKLVGENDVPRQIDATFGNLKTALSAARAEPRHVVKVTHYFVDYRLEFLDALFRNLRETFPADAMPSSTLLCVTRLARDGLRYELTAEAVLPDEHEERLT